MCNPQVPIPFGAEVSFDLPPASHLRPCAHTPGCHPSVGVRTGISALSLPGYDTKAILSPDGEKAGSSSATLLLKRSSSEAPRLWRPEPSEFITER